MAATAYAGDPAALPFRVENLERNETKMSDKLARVDDQVEAHGLTLAAQHEQIGSLTSTVSDLKDAVKWTNRILIGLCLSITGSAVAVVFTLGGPT